MQRGRPETIQIYGYQSEGGDPRQSREEEQEAILIKMHQKAEDGDDTKRAGRGYTDQEASEGEDLQAQRKGRDYTDEKASERGGPATIQRKGREYTDQEESEGEGFATMQRGRAEAIQLKTSSTRDCFCNGYTWDVAI